MSTSFCGFAFAGYRSIGTAMAKIAPLRKINFIVGQNNSGKSNIIGFLHKQFSLFYRLAKAENNGVKTFEPIDMPLHAGQVMHRIGFPISIPLIEEYIDDLFSQTNDNQLLPVVRDIAIKVLQECFQKDNDFIWFVFSSHSVDKNFELEYDIDKVYDLLGKDEWRRLWSALTRRTGGDISAHWIPQTLQILATIPDLPKVELIPAIRKIGVPGSERVDYSGEGIIARLAELQHPPLEKNKDREKFEQINSFLKAVLENPTARIEIPHKNDCILVHMDEKVLPLHSLGTGIHEVIILASTATEIENSILCIEEPELHLHPTLQRKLIQYLESQTTNQYIIATHSAHLLDAVDSEVFHVSMAFGESIVSAVQTDQTKLDVCRDLGYKASDILQANSIVWVEGPSDRIYINYWLKAKRPDLIEGVHYSVMFFGGRLFSHITADTDRDMHILENLISIRRLNQNSAIMFDSDKDKPRKRLSDTKLRLKDEFGSGGGFAWVTQGREVENYLDERVLRDIVMDIHPTAAGLVSEGQYANLLKYKRKKDGKICVADKIKVARNYTYQAPVNFDVLDLDRQTNLLVNFIDSANGQSNIKIQKPGA
jgi:predicted ATPase